MSATASAYGHLSAEQITRHARSPGKRTPSRTRLKKL
jgi:hypothetical protein